MDRFLLIFVGADFDYLFGERKVNSDDLLLNECEGGGAIFHVHVQ